MSGRRPEALIITVNYRGAPATLKFIESFRRMESRHKGHVIIVDNASNDSSCQVIGEAIEGLENFELMASPVNRGYFGGANWALLQYLGQRERPDWVIVCNHDVVIEDKEFFVKLFAQDPAGVGVIAPRIQVAPGRMDQNPFMRRRPGRLRWAGLRLSFSSYGLASVWDWLSRRKHAWKSYLAARTGKQTGKRGEERRAIYAGHGAFFIFSRKYFEAGGYLDGNLFLYGEEISVAEICRSLGLAVVYDPSLKVSHRAHTSTGNSISRFSFECQKKALEYVSARYLTCW